MIQILTFTGNDKKLEGRKTEINSLNRPKSLDSFEINIIDLTDENMWNNDNRGTSKINKINDLISLSKMLENCVKAKNIILLPQNSKFFYYKSNGNWTYKCELKDIIDNVKDNILSKVYEPIKNFNIVYENTKNRLCEYSVDAAFYFNIVTDEILTRSEKSNKVTTIRRENIILSTLSLKTYNEIIAFLKTIGLINEKEDVPEWIKGIEMFDDEEQICIIEENNIIIKEAEENINKAQLTLDKNNKYKSSLYTSGDELVEVIFDILEKMLGCDLSGFKDEKKEDFNFKINNRVFIGEIKGIGTNVKKLNVAQLDTHVQQYLDEYEEFKEEDIVALLIINHQRNKPLYERESIHNDQIKIAKRNNSLIVETITLLKMFEKYLSGQLTREDCVKILYENKGLLSV